MLPLVGLVAPYGVGYLLGWCIVDFHFKYSQCKRWMVLLWKTFIGILCMVLCVLAFRGLAERAIAKDMEYLGSVDSAIKLMEEYADAYTADSTADRYIYVLEANHILIKKQKFNKIFAYVLDSPEYDKFMSIDPVRPPISDKAWSMAMDTDKPDWISVKQQIVNEVRRQQISAKDK